MSNINLFSIIPTEINEYICSFLPEKDYRLYDMVSKNFATPLWSQYLSKRNIKAVGTGREQVLEDVRTYCNLLIPQSDIKKYLIDPSSIAFEVKEALKKLSGTNGLVIDFQTALWNIYVQEGKTVSRGAINTLLEFDLNTFKTLYHLYTTQAIQANLDDETFKNFIEKVISVSSSQDMIKYLKSSIAHNNTLAIEIFLKNIAEFDSTILTLALSQKLNLKILATILNKTKVCDFENLITAFKGDYTEEIKLQIINKLALLNDAEITSSGQCLNSMNREFSKKTIRDVKNIQANITTLDPFMFDNLLKQHEIQLSDNDSKWLSKNCSMEVLAKLLTKEIDWKTFYQYYEYKMISSCVLNSHSLKLKESILNAMPIAAFNFKIDQFLLASKAQPPKLEPVTILRDEALIKGAEILLFKNKDMNQLDLKLNADNIDIYAQETFNTIIEHQKAHKLPTFIATFINPITKELEVTEAVSFNRQFHKFNNKADNTNSNLIHTFKFYKNTKIDKVFTFMCDQQTILENNDHFAKRINASDLNMDSTFRGQERAYMSRYYAELAIESEEAVTGVDLTPDRQLEHLYKAIHYYKKSRFWLEKAIEDKDIDSYLTLIDWYRFGNLITDPSFRMMMYNLNLAAHTVSDCDIRARQILTSYLNILNNNDQVEDRKKHIAYCRSRLTKLPVISKLEA